MFTCEDCKQKRKEAERMFVGENLCAYCVEKDRGTPIPGKLGMFSEPPDYVKRVLRRNGDAGSQEN